MVNTVGFLVTARSPFLVQKHKNFVAERCLLLYISKYIITFAPVIVLTLKYSLMKYKVSYTDRAGHVFSFKTADIEVYHFIGVLTAHGLKSINVSFIEPEQKGGQYEQQPE